MIIPGQTYETRGDDIELQLPQCTANDQIQDEFCKVNKLSNDLLKMICSMKVKRGPTNRPAIDYEKFIKAIEEEDDILTMEEMQVEDTSSQSDSTLTDTTIQKSTSNSGSSNKTDISIDDSNIETTSDDYDTRSENQDTLSDDQEWLLPTPNNSPEQTDVSMNIPIDAEDLSYALEHAINSLARFNLRHPTAPSGSKGRTCRFKGNYFPRNRRGGK